MNGGKIPWIECIMRLPDKTEEQLKELLLVYKRKSRGKNKLKKKNNRITTDENIIKSINEFIENIKLNKSSIYDKVIINFLETIIKKFINLYIHIDNL